MAGDTEWLVWQEERNLILKKPSDSKTSQKVTFTKNYINMKWMSPVGVWENINNLFQMDHGKRIEEFFHWLQAIMYFGVGKGVPQTPLREKSRGSMRANHLKNLFHGISKFIYVGFSTL